MFGCQCFPEKKLNNFKKLSLKGTYLLTGWLKQDIGVLSLEFGYSIRLSVIRYFKSFSLLPVFTSFVSTSPFSFEERFFLHDDNIGCQKQIETKWTMWDPLRCHELLCGNWGEIDYGMYSITKTLKAEKNLT